jgi:hypothetical protein
VTEPRALRSIDFGPVRAGVVELGELGRGFGPGDLAAGIRALSAQYLECLDAATDADVTFVPDDTAAADTFASDPDEVALAWTLGHVIVHVSASAEEAAFLAAELARGVEPHGRSRHEVPWATMRTVAECRKRLLESERMILASLASWPDEPNLEVASTTSKGSARNAPARCLGGLMHADEHLAQVSEILRQAHLDRGAPLGR